MLQAPKDPANKRTATRIPVALPVIIGKKMAHTRDMSVNGVYVETDDSYAPGSKLDFTVDLQYARPDGPLRLVCSGHIVRVERRGVKLGIAVSIDQHRFEIAGEQARSSRK